MDEFQFMLEDRIAKIKAINEQYDLEHNAYISFSGGKDSVVLSHLVDLALLGNTIPRVYANTGIEYNDMVKYVKSLAQNDDRFIILNQTNNIKKTLEKYGYPFKSKEHSLRVQQYKEQKNSNYIKKYISGYDEKHGKLTKFKCPNILKYQFTPEFNLNISNLCCKKLKKDLMRKYAKDHKKTITITGMRNNEGGNRTRLTCLTNKGKMFHPLIVVSDEFEEKFIQHFDIKLCKLYYPPYNFKRTGCKGCPFALTLQEQLDTMEKLLPNEKKQCEILWKPIYDEYRRIGYRLRKENKVKQLSIFDLLE